MSPAWGQFDGESTLCGLITNSLTKGKGVNCEVESEGDGKVEVKPW
ncbi:MAG: hypothetical protein ACYDIA_09095 [Candidatus Humimicrobiaceae bacterium]